MPQAEGVRVFSAIVLLGSLVFAIFLALVISEVVLAVRLWLEQRKR